MIDNKVNIVLYFVVKARMLALLLIQTCEANMNNQEGKSKEPEQWYRVVSRGELQMFAPMRTIAEAYDLRTEAIIRATNQTKNGGVVELYFNGRHPRLVNIIVTEWNGGAL